MKLNHLKRMSLIMAIVFCFSLFSGINPVKAYADDAQSSSKTVEPADVAVLVGSLMKSNGIGNDWDPADYNGQLTEYGNGIYEKAFELNPGTYDYKIAMNGKWDKCYSGANGKDRKDNNTLLDLSKNTEKTKVYFRLDLKKGTVVDSVNDPKEFKAKAVFTGEADKILEKGSNWDPADDNAALDYVGGGIYQKAFKISDEAQKKENEVSYKVAFNGAWSNGEIPSDNATVKIPAGTKELTVYANYLTGDVTDSIKTPVINDVVRVVGTVSAWDPNCDTLKMHQFAPGKFMIASKIKKGSYEYKATANGTWDNNALCGCDAVKNTALELAEDTNVVFVTDLIEHKTIDSVNNLNDVKIALGLKSKVVTVESPKVNGNGTVTFSYMDAAASKVELDGNIANGKVSMTKDADDVWSTTLRIGDEAKKVEYNFIVDGKKVTDPCNKKAPEDGKSILDFPKFEGRPVTLPGSIQTSVGAQGWAPADKNFQFTYEGNGNYKYVLKNPKAGSYEYKIGINFSWDPENYGLNGVEHGANIPITIPNNDDITFIYNDDSHLVVNSISYKVLDITLKDGGKELAKLSDARLTGVYTASVALKAGKYDKLSLTVVDENGKSTDVKLDPFELANDKTVTFSYDPMTGIAFNDASDKKVDMNGINYNSRLEEYKKPYGATVQGEPITFNIGTAKDDASEVKLVVSGPDGLLVENMTKNGTMDNGSDRWTYEYTPKKVGTFAYYFVVSNGSDVKAYGDDDGFFGKGIAGNIGEVKNYEFNIYAKDYKTPDWLKNGVVYQIFPDRFFNGDPSNDFLQKYGRGDNPYEFEKDWYSIPKDPQFYGKDEYPENANKGNGEYGNDFYGGDLKGIEDKVEYLKSLGVTVLYMNPIGKSISAHRYDTTDYNSVDPLLGTMDDFVSLANAAHKNGMHIILDGVYNHVADDSIYFDRYAKYMAPGKPLGAYQYWSRVYDMMNKDGVSQEDAEAKVTADLNDMGITDLHYKDWFVIKNVIDKKNKDGDLPENLYHYDYEGWDDYDNMPVIQALNGSEYNVKSWADEIIDGEDSSARQWLRNGADGIRLDCGGEVSDETWEALRKAIREEGDNALVGEIWTDASKDLYGNTYDSVQNYRFRSSVLNFVRGTYDDNKTVSSAKTSMDELEKMREQYPREAMEAMFNLVGSHDTQRIISALDGYEKSVRGFAKPATDGAKAKMKLIPFVQMTYIGAPTIYYGDEIGMVGCDDPDDRRAFTWGQGDKEQVEWYATLAAIRSEYSALRTGDLNPAVVQKAFENDVMAYVRQDENASMLIASNRQDKEVETVITTPGIKDGTVLTNLLDKSQTYTVNHGSVTVKIPSMNGVILADQVKDIEVNLDGLKSSYEGEKVESREIPKTEAEVMEAINASNDGDEVVISDMNEGISMDVIDAVINSGKKITPVIVRDNIKIAINDIAALKQALKDSGSNDFQLVKKEVSDEKTDKVKDNLISKFDLETNLKDKSLGADALFTVVLDAKYNGNTLYAYTIGEDGSFKLISSAVVKDGELSYKSASLSDVVILNQEVKAAETDPEQKPDPEKKPDQGKQDGGKEQNPAGKTDKGDQAGTDAKGTKTNVSKLPQTGSPIGTTSEFIAAIILLVAGAGVIVCSKKKKRA